ncbi:MAG: amidohydrolase family protein [Planctomycetota bacterium]|jgi:predicted TIM-barrel fold metal-dependent hydrolase
MPPAVAEKTTFFRQGWSDIDLLLRALDAAGVEKAVLLYPTSDAHVKLGGWGELCALYNAAIAEKVKQHPDRLIGAGILPVDRPDEMLPVLARIRELGLSCLSLASSYEGAYLDDQRFLPVLEEAGRQGLPVFVHAQIIDPIGIERVKDPLLMPVVEYLFDITISAGAMMMSGARSRLEGLKVVFAHFGGVLPFLADRFDSTYSMLRSRGIVKDLGSPPTEILKNIFVDTSGTRSPQMLNMAVEFFGAERILWGSDHPANRDMAGSIAAVADLSLVDAEREDILSGNLGRLFG